MIRAPIQPLGNGKTKVTHQPLPDEGGTWIQTTGGGTFTSNYLSWGAGRVEQIRGAAAAGGQYGTRGQGTMLVTKTFISEFQSMTFDAGGPGPFVERMWNTISKPMQDMTDMTGTEGTPLWSAGHIKRLGPDDQVNLGESGLVSAPGATFGELPKWSPMPTLGG